MSENDLSARLRAVERALTDGDSMPDLAAAANAEQRLDALESEVETLAERVDALDATVQSLHGYVGELEHVNDRVERRADAARAAVERLEGRRTAPSTGPTADHTDAESELEEQDTEIQAGADTSAFDWDDAESVPDSDEESLLGRVRDAL